MKNKNQNGIRQQCINNLGDRLGILYYDLWCDVANLYTAWDIYLELFGTCRHRVLLMEEISSFFGIMQKCLKYDIILRISRITDKPSFGKGRENRTIRWLPQFVELKKACKVNKLVQQSIIKNHECRILRNKAIAHMNYSYFFKSGDKLRFCDSNSLIKFPPLDTINEGIESIADVINAVFKFEWGFDDLVLDFDKIGISSFFKFIIDGLQATNPIRFQKLITIK